MIRNCIRVCALLLFGLAGADAAWAQSCTYSASGMNFGVISGSPPPQTDTTSNIAITCSGTAGTTVRVCLNIGTGSATGSTVAQRTMAVGTTSTLNFNLYRDAGRTLIWGSRGTAPTYLPLTVDIPIPASGTASTNATVYGRIASGQPAKPAGTYTNSFSGGQGGEARVTTTSTGLICGSLPVNPRTRFSFTSSVAVGAACSLTASNISFGTAVGLGAARDVTGSLSVACTLGAAYSIALNGGTTMSAINNRRMSLGGVGAGVVSYQLYRDTLRTLVWGDGTTGTVSSGTGTGSTQAVPVYARVLSQATPPAGAYEDTVTVTLTY